jgi:hypothetical protein
MEYHYASTAIGSILRHDGDLLDKSMPALGSFIFDGKPCTIFCLLTTFGWLFFCSALMYSLAIRLYFQVELGSSSSVFFVTFILESLRKSRTSRMRLLGIARSRVRKSNLRLVRNQVSGEVFRLRGKS